MRRAVFVIVLAIYVFRIYAALHALPPGAVSFRRAAVSENRSNFILQFTFGLRGRMKGIIYESMGRPYNAILTAMLLGERSAIPKQINNSFMKTGTIHIMAISGFNVGLLSFLLLILLSAMRIPRRVRLVLCILFLTFYALLVGAQSSVLRATIMAIIYWTAELLGRETNHYRSLAIAAALILAFNPLAIFHCDFLLSFASVFFILYFARRMDKNLRLLPRFLRTPLSVSLAAWLGVLPLVAWFFNIVTPVAIIANLVIVPLSSIAMAQGVACVIAGFFVPTVGEIFGRSSQFSLYLATWFSQKFQNLPLAYLMVRKPYLWQILLYYVTFLLWASRVKENTKQ